MTPLVTTFAGDSARGEGLFSASSANPIATKIIVGNNSAQNVKQVPLSSFTITGTVATGANTYPNQCAVDPSLTFVYVIGSTSLFKINMTTFTLTSTLALAGTLQSIVIDKAGAYAYVSSSSNNIYKIDLNTFTSVATFAQTLPGYLALDPSNTYLYCSSFVNNYVRKITVSTFASAGTVSIVSATGMAINAAGTLMYVINQNNNILATVTLSSFTVTANTAIPTSQAQTCIIDPTGNYLYITDYGAGNVVRCLVSNIASNTTLGGFSSPNSIAIDPSGLFAYIANAGFNNINKISLSTFTISSSLTGFSFPTGLCIGYTNYNS